MNNVQVGDNPLKIAVSVPTGNKSSIAQEILRGVAYAQSEVNKTGINDRKLLVEIINDDNDKEVVKKVAQELVTDPTIVAVIGHNKSSSSLAAARIYEDKLVMVSPTSTADNLSNFNKFIFRSVLTNKKMTKALATYVVESVKEAKIAICFAKSDINSKSFREVFIESVKEKGGTVYPICDLSDKNFNIDSKLKEIKRKANALLLVPDLNNLQVAVKLANANQGELALFAEPTMYTQETLEGNVEGLVVVAPWHGSMSKKFDGNMESFWGGKVNWRTATAYDATRAIIVGLQEEQTRQGLQKVLRSKEFKAEGENGEIEFDDVSGDRLGTPVILKVSGGEFRNITDSKL